MVKQWCSISCRLYKFDDFSINMVNDTDWISPRCQLDWRLYCKCALLMANRFMIIKWEGTIEQCVWRWNTSVLLIYRYDYRCIYRYEMYHYSYKPELWLNTDMVIQESKCIISNFEKFYFIIYLNQCFWSIINITTCQHVSRNEL